MSHYTVLVINTKGKNDVDAQLAPFDENIEMPEYEKGEVSADDIQRFISYYTEKDSSLKGMPLKELYDLKGEDWNGECWKFNDDGTIVELSTYNPNSKWDWYEVGGRWAGSLKLKDEIKPENEPNFSWGWSEEAKREALMKNLTDQAHKGQIDFEGMRDAEAFDNAMRFWEIYVDGDEPKNKEEEELVKHTFYKPQYYRDRYKSKTLYATCVTNFTTYAVLKDGKWYAPGEMGWFGMSSEDGDEGLEWDLKFYDEFIKDLPDEALLTVVDCHI
jgi:hypothetical protein